MELYEKIKSDLMKVLVAYIVIQLAWVMLPLGRDDTDGETRSGLALRTDARTGCQYLESVKGGLTPRLDREGRHVCN